MAAKSSKTLPKIGARRAAFLKHLAKNANVSKSAKLARISTSSLYNHRARTPSFAAAWEEAMSEALDDLEQTVIERAKHGVEKPVFFGGNQIGTVRNYSDALAMFILKARRPEVYARLNAESDVDADGADEAARAEVMRRIERLKDDEA